MCPAIVQTLTARAWIRALANPFLRGAFGVVRTVNIARIVHLRVGAALGARYIATAISIQTAAHVTPIRTVTDRDTIPTAASASPARNRAKSFEQL